MGFIDFREVVSHDGPCGSHLDPERATKTSGSIVRLRTVVTHEDAAVAAITIERATKFSDIRRCCNPARRLRIELAQLLQLEILFFRQKLDAHGPAMSLTLFLGLCSF